MFNPIILKGEYNECKVFADNIEPAAQGQLQAMLDLELFKSCKIRIMPDVCPSKGTVVGLTMKHPPNIIFPGLLGPDLFCGITTIKIKSKIKPDLNKLDKVIRSNIPAGMGKLRSTPHKESEALQFMDHVVDLNIPRAKQGLGTLGGGNHFIELGMSEDKEYYLSVHTGSRNVGAKITEYWNDLAYKAFNDPNIPYTFAPLIDQDNINNYLIDLNFAEKYAELNSNIILHTICKEMGFKILETVRSVHNYITMPTPNTIVLRKGAIFMSYDKSIIGLNMRDGLLLVESINDLNAHFSEEVKDWNISFPHGTGRKYSRTDTEQNFTVNEFKKQMDGIYSTSINKDTLDESPMAYKDSNRVIEIIKPFTKSIKVIKPIYSFKGGK